MQPLGLLEDVIFSQKSGPKKKLHPMLTLALPVKFITLNTAKQIGNGFILKALNHTLISLILKTPHPINVENVRPTNLCN
ncbi:hypothetical protein BUALT_Bualt12G0084900 [Buddleja alternifolia]|uniref:Uncharacterized protein n=1 Tax=Buddleja alternifolia TaxID=168488 RepID=A0AAV6WQ39_9LAMI|nr:hypothetical protein BUALT_Bualt12G0084900 [Buddleja alternifolia]